jgi:hypothetical protein
MTSAVTVRATQPEAKSNKRRPAHVRVTPSTWQLKVFTGFVAAVIAGYIGYVIAFGVNVVFWDDWSWVNFATDPGRISLGNLWVQHTENIMFFPNVVAAILIPISHWNSLTFMWLSAGMLIGVLAISIHVLWDEIKRSPLRWLPLPVIVLALTQYQDTLWAFQIAWFMCLLALFGAVAILIRPHLSTTHLVCAALLGVVGSYSSFSGLLIWPVGLVVLLAKGQSARARLLWCAIGVLVTAGYFVGFNWSATDSAPIGYILSHLSAVSEGVLITAGSVIPNMTSGISAISSSVITEVVGGILLVSGLAVIGLWLRGGRATGAPVFCVALIVTSILFALTLVPSRLAYSPTAGTTSRYDTFMWPLLLGTYAYAAMHFHWPSKQRRWVLLPQIVLTMTVAAAAVVGTVVGIHQGQITRTVRLTSVDVLANMQTAPTALLAPYLVPPCANQAAECIYLKTEARALQVRRMSVFSDPKEVEQLRALGIVPSGAAPRLLAVPQTLRAQVDSSSVSRAAWTALSAAYWSDQKFQQHYPETARGTKELLRWAIASGDTVTTQTVIADEWLAPVSVAFFLAQYKSVYQSWLSPGNS